MDGQRIADIYRELGFPSAPKFQTALRKQGINVSLDNLRDLIKTLGSRQIFRPPPQYKGNVTARSIDDRWVADVLSFESRPVEGFTNVLLIQDVFSRFLWASPMGSKKETTRAFRTHLNVTGRVCRELSTDKGTEFTSAEFQRLVAEEGIHHRFKVALNDLSTIGRAMGVLKDRIAVIAAEAGDSWLDALQTAVNAHNSLDAKALLDNAPEDVAQDDELRFRLRQENAEKTQENVELATKRREKLEAEGGFRTLLPNANRRTGLPNWSSDVRQVDKAMGGVVYDTGGGRHDTRNVLPVPVASSGIVDVFRGGYVARDERRREAMRPYKERLVQLIQERGPLQLSGAARLLGRDKSFKQTMSAQRLRFPTFLELFDDLVTTGRGQQTIVSLAPRA